jgi:hypothetical protein
MYLSESVLGKVAAVAIIVALSLHHRISGMLALLVIIAFMQQTREGFTPSIEISSGTKLKNFTKDKLRSMTESFLSRI